MTITLGTAVDSLGLLDGTNEELAAVAGLLTDTHRGALIVGGPGTGKTTLAVAALDALPPGRHVERIRGSAGVANQPFGALGYLVSELTPEAAADPLRVVGGLGTVLRRRAEGREIVVFVDNAHLVDAESAAALSQLAVEGTVRMLACCDNSAGVPATFLGMWRNQALGRLDLHGLTRARTGAWLDRWLGERVSGDAAQALHEASGGNPLLLRVLASEWRDSGTLELSRGWWILSANTAVPGNELAGVRPVQLEGLTDRQRRVVETLAMLGAAPVLVPASLCDDDDMDVLYRRGLLAAVPGIRAAVQLQSRLIREVLRRGISPARSRQLLADLQRSDPWTLMSLAVWSDSFPLRRALVDLVGWMVDSGVEPEARWLLAAARTACEIAHYGSALRLLDAAPASVDAVESGLLRVRALLGANHRADASDALGSIEARVATADDAGVARPEQRVDIAVYRSHLARTSASTASTARQELLLARTESEWNAAGGDGVGGTVARAACPYPRPRATGAEQVLERRLALEDAELALFEGRYRDVSAEALARGLHGADLSTRLRGAALLVEALAATGRVDQARNLAREMASETGPSLRTEGDEAWIRSWNNLSRQQLWGECGVLLEGRRPGGARQRHGANATAVVAYAVNEAESGRTEHGAAILERVAAEVKAGRRHLPGALVHAAAAYVAVLAGDPSKARRHLDRPADAERRESRGIDVVTGYYRAMAGAALGDRGQSAARLLSDAAQAGRGGARADELRLLAGAARLGNVEALHRMVAAAADVDSGFARTMSAYGRGLLAGNAGLLLQAASWAEAGGNQLLAREASRLALSIAAESRDTAAMRGAQRVLRRAAERFDFAALQGTGPQALTDRELAIADLVARGLSNGDAARKLGVSVRTVEGHLHKVYSKLQAGIVPLVSGAALAAGDA